MWYSKIGFEQRFLETKGLQKPKNYDEKLRLLRAPVADPLRQLLVPSAKNV